MENIDDKKLYVTLSEYCNAVKDGTHDSPKRVDDGKFLITSKHICDNKIDFSSAYKISVEDYNNINRRSKVDKWDLLMSMIGTVGRLYIVKEEPDYAIKNLALFKNNDEWHAKYLYYYLGSKLVQDYFEAVANGTTQHFVGLGYLRKFKVPKWTDDKLKTVKILDSYDKLIEKNNRKIAILEEQIQELYKEWFVRFRFPGYEKVKFVNGLPIDWEYKRLREMVQYYRGLSYSSEEIDTDSGVDLVNLNNIISYGGFNKNGTKKYAGKYKETQTLKDSDLVMGVTDMTQERRLVGSVALVDTKGVKTAFSADLIKLISSVNKLFLYCMLKYGNYSKYIAEFANGANVLHLKPDSVMSVKVLMPSEKLITKFAMSVENYFNSIKQIKELNDILLKQRDLLLPRLMSGRLKV